VAPFGKLQEPSFAENFPPVKKTAPPLTPQAARLGQVHPAFVIRPADDHAGTPDPLAGQDIVQTADPA
jgi:hypothetical protein